MGNVKTKTGNDSVSEDFGFVPHSLMSDDAAVTF